MLQLLDSLCEQHHVATSQLRGCCHQANSDWRSSEITSHYQTIILGIDDLNILSIWNV
ncbi:Tryptophan synthase beta chain [Gossypium arboreum]|uniref:Tryptophan synthase beta chain n=1 Tax=Gossypium arboreum TaxID=29729 RepID=A0A0B0P0G8_GOSAR|nr:Tryptophan synthase beta chain [Gossypium arboreum]